MMKLSQVPAVKDLLRKCVRCGQCRSVCPIFKELKNEGAAPRAHVYLTQLLRDGELEPGAPVAARAGRCLLCKSCAKECPSGIPVDQMVVAMRAYLQDYSGENVKKFVLSNLWGRPKGLQKLRFLLKTYEASGLKSLLQKTGLLGLISKDLERANKLLGSVSRPMASQTIPPIAQARQKRKIRVGYFLGCATNIFFPSVAHAAIQVLRIHGCEVVTPKNLQCCGMPHIASGQATQAKSMTEHNFRLFYQAGVEAIISDCASCTSMLQGDYYDQLFAAELPEEVSYFKGKIFDLNQFLIDQIDLNESLGPVQPVKVTYHDPCHLVKGQGVTEQPRKILNLIPGVDLVEMEGADQCCGGAGTFSLTHYELSKKILGRKINSIRDTDAQLVTTSCPACSMQLAHGLTEHGMEIVVKHPVELLAKAYEDAGRDSKTS